MVVYIGWLLFIQIERWFVLLRTSNLEIPNAGKMISHRGILFDKEANVFILVYLYLYLYLNVFLKVYQVLSVYSNLCQ